MAARPARYELPVRAPEHRDGRPLEENWASRTGAEDFEDATPLAGAYRPGARRFDAGQRSNFVLVTMAAAALEQVLDWGADMIAAALGPVTHHIDEQARARGLDPLPAPLRAAHMLGVRLPAGPATGLAERLAGDNVHVEILGSVMRVSPHLHTSEEDLGLLFESLDNVLGGTHA